MKKLMLGNEAVARGLYEAGCRFVSSYPGTPSTEITEVSADYDEIYVEWASNEKVAAESAFGACVEGARSFTAMKHVGLNVATDLVFTSSYTGVNAGFVIAVADDQGMHSSQNEQDSRHYAEAAKLPMLEPCDSAECRDYAKLAYRISEEYDTPVFLRLSTRVSHSQSQVELGEREDVPVKPYVKNPAKFVMSPANAMRRHPVVEERTLRLTELANTQEINHIIEGDHRIGVIAGGIAYDYAREALGDRACYLKLGMLWPLPTDLIRSFAEQVDTLYVIEELDPVIETHVRALGIPCKGKELFSRIGEYTVGGIREKLLGEPQGAVYAAEDVPVRPPVLCPGCPHRGLFYVLNRMKVSVSGDIGCYTLGAAAPLSAMDSTIDMGASISMLHGRIKANPDCAKNTVAVIGDSTFIHSGLTGLINITYNASPATVIIADNSITGMTGHQPNPATGVTIRNQQTNAVNLEEIVRACGVRRVRVVDPYDLEQLEAVLREELAAEEPSVVISRRPCALLKGVKRGKPLTIDGEKCRRCRMCMRIGCPAISFESGHAAIDASLCVGCGLCKSLCKFDCIGE